MVIKMLLVIMKMSPKSIMCFKNYIKLLKVFKKNKKTLETAQTAHSKKIPSVIDRKAAQKAKILQKLCLETSTRDGIECFRF